MEKYVIDLDKVLDELELHDNDEATGQFVPNTFSSTTNAQIPNSDNNPLQNFYKFPASSIVSSYDKIDVQDADFSIQTKPPKILNSIANWDPPPSVIDVQTNYLHNVIINDEQVTPSPVVNDNHVIQSEQPAVTKWSQVSLNEPPSAFIDDHSTNEPARETSVSSPPPPIINTDTSTVEKVATSTVTNLPTHCNNVDDENVPCVGGEVGNNDGGSSSSNSNDIANLLDLPVIEDKLPEADVINVNHNDLNSNSVPQFDGAITNDNSNEVHLLENNNISQSEPQPDELNNSICDNDNCDKSIVVSNCIEPLDDDLNEKVATFVSQEEEQIVDTIVDPFKVEQNSSTQDGSIQSEPVIEELISESKVQVVELEPVESSGATTASATGDGLDELDINNMSEADLDKFLCDLETTVDDVGEKCEQPETSNNEEQQAFLDVDSVKENETPPSNESTETSQIAEVVEQLQTQQPSPPVEDNIPIEVVDEKAIVTDLANTEELKKPSSSDSPVDFIVPDAVPETMNEINSICSEEASAILSEFSPPVDVNEPAPAEPSRPRSLTLQQQQNVPTEANQGAAAVTAASAPTTSETASSGSTDTNRGGLVQNIAYFERQEMPNGLTEEEQMLGKVKPFWIPDEEAQNCLHCDSKFTLIKRRHHCRSCGKVLCSQCCNFKAKLMYLENKEARVCQLCYAVLIRIEEIEKANGHPIDISEIEQSSSSNSSMVNNSLNINFPDPNNPAEYCSTISPFEQALEVQNRPPPTVMVPVGVLKRPGSSSIRRGGNSSESSLQGGERPPEVQVPVKQVIFSDGVRPGGDLVESPSSTKLPEERPVGRTQLQLKSPPVEKQFLPNETAKRVKPSRLVVPDNNGVNLPPILNYNELKSHDSSLPSKPTYLQLLHCLRHKHLPPVTFGLTKNLFVNVKLVSKLCCNSIECWAFASRGLATVGQDEVFFCLDCNSIQAKPVLVDEIGKSGGVGAAVPSSSSNSDYELLEFPRDVFRLFTLIYDSASKASLYTELSHIFFPDGLFGNKENSGFIFTRPSLQCFQNALVPSPPNLIAILIHKWEIPWAKVFPLRLALRLGHEYSMYPTPVISFANRKPVYFEIGHTIMNVLADFRNFQYTLSVVKDLVIHVEERKRVSLQIPKLSYEKVCKVLSTSNEHVLAFGGNFSIKADSHFVCVQNEQDDDVHGQYHTQVAHYGASPQKLTGASFIVFSGALKSSTGLKAKMNIVEDGLLVQIPPATMEELRAAIRDMKEFQIDCCKVTESESSDEWVKINWVNDELSTNLGVRSQIDGLNLEGVQSARIFSSPDYTNERYLIRWIEVFLLQINENSRRSEMLNTSRLAESVSQAFCVALIDFLDQLYESGLTKIGLRVSLDVDKVGYEAGSAGEPLPPQFTGQLDSALIPAIMENISTTGIEDPLVIELLFYILLK